MDRVWELERELRGVMQDQLEAEESVNYWLERMDGYEYDTDEYMEARDKYWKACSKLNDLGWKQSEIESTLEMIG